MLKLFVQFFELTVTTIHLTNLRSQFSHLDQFRLLNDLYVLNKEDTAQIVLKHNGTNLPSQRSFSVEIVGRNLEQSQEQLDGNTRQ